MAVKTIFIHIGPYKTGTTTIQESLFAEQETLRQDGVLVPAVGQPFPGNVAHHNLVWEILNDPHFLRANGNWDDLLSVIEKAPQKKVILSSEEFSRLPAAGITELKEKLAHCNLRIIIYLRRQDTLIQSLWAEMLKSGNHREFHFSLHEWLEIKQYQFFMADFHKVLSRWGRVFGKENLVVRVLEGGQLHGALFHDFLYACGISAPEKYALHRDSNISPGAKELLLIGELKKRLLNRLDENVAVQFYFFVRRFAEENGWNAQRVNLVDAALYSKIMEPYQEINRTVAREFFEREELFLEPFRENEISQFSVSDFHPDELLDLFAFVAAKMCEKEEDKADHGALERQYREAKKELEAVHASWGWKWLQKLRALKRKLQIVAKR